MYMSVTVGIAELRRDLSRFLKMVRDGERIVVTDHNKPVAEIGPPVEQMSRYEQLIASGKLKPPKKPGGMKDLPPPLPRKEGEPTLTEILLEMRDEERF